MRRGELEARLLVLVTLALVAFGLVMVYSATSAAAAVGGADPSYYLKRQGIYAAIGIALMVVVQRWDYRRLRPMAPTLVLVSLVLLVLVLAIGPAVNGARRWITVGPAAFQPSELAKLALAVWAAAYLTRRAPPADLRELGRPFGLVAGIFALLDRKSTRLNSSHVKISYAVFCLKKKNKIQTTLSLFYRYVIYSFCS